MREVAVPTWPMPLACHCQHGRGNQCARALIPLRDEPGELRVRGPGVPPRGLDMPECGWGAGESRLAVHEEQAGEIQPGHLTDHCPETADGGLPTETAGILRDRRHVTRATNSISNPASRSPGLALLVTLILATSHN